MDEEDAEKAYGVAERQPCSEDIRVNTLTFNRQQWPYSFDMPFIPDPGRNLASVGACYVPAEFAAFDGVFDTQCVRTHEPLVLLGYLFKNGVFLDPLDDRILIGKSVFTDKIDNGCWTDDGAWSFVCEDFIGKDVIDYE